MMRQEQFSATIHASSSLSSNTSTSPTSPCVTPPPPNDYEDRECPDKPRKPKKKNMSKRGSNFSSTELDGMKEKWVACRKALAADDDESPSNPIVPPQPPTPMRSFGRPRLFSRDATVEWEGGDADPDGVQEARAAHHDKENNAKSSTTSTSPSTHITGTPSTASTSRSASTLLSSSYWPEATPSRIFRPTPSRTTYTSANSSKAGGGNGSSSSSRRKATLHPRKLSSSELPSLAEAWKLSRRSLELEELEVETAAIWVGSKPQVLFQARKKRGSIAEASESLASVPVSG